MEELSTVHMLENGLYVQLCIKLYDEFHFS